MHRSWDPAVTDRCFHPAGWLQRIIVVFSVVVIVWMSSGWMSAASAAEPVRLGDDIRLVRGSAHQIQEGSQSRIALEARSGSEAVTAVANKRNRVYRIDIHSTAQEAPDPQEYLGDYASFAQEQVAVFPLKGRIVRYHQGDRAASWSVFGMSGNFSAEALSEDLAVDE